MIHLIGNSAGVGSSLLSQILNRHSQVFSGKDSHLFTKKVLYTNWEENKSRILSKGIKGLRSSGWHLYNGTESDTIFNAKPKQRKLSG